MKKFIVLSIVLGLMGTNSLILKESTADAKLFSKDIQQEQVAKLPAKYSPSIIWLIG